MWQLSALFAAFYFIQGICEPTEGLIAQPVRSLLKNWGKSAAEITAFGALLSVPWMLKPVYGLVTDLVPLGGYRRKSYLLLTNALAAAGLGALALVPLDSNSVAVLFCLLLLPTVCVAFSDVVVDALMVERGQPLGITGRLQSFQWSAMWAASILIGYVGGYLSHIGKQQAGFAISFAAVAAALALSVFFVKEPSRPDSTDQLSFRDVVARAARLPAVWAGGAFIFLWQFNPFSTGVLYVHMTREMRFSEAFYGETVSIAAFGSLLGSLLYATYCRRVSMTWLLNLAVAMGVMSTAAYAAMYHEASARIVAFAVGFTYSTATMVQFDLAARICPPELAGTLFALLMALANLALSLSAWLGGQWYDRWLTSWGSQAAFEALVAIGATLTACCWLLVPILARCMPRR